MGVEEQHSNDENEDDDEVYLWNDLYDDTEDSDSSLV